MEQIIQFISQDLGIKPNQVHATLKLLEEGNTVPFIARYRKEMTQALDEDAIFKIQEEYQYQCNLNKRKEDVKRLIEVQGKLSEELIRAIDACKKLVEVEDIYRPYQQKRKTRASIAIQKGLEPLSKYLLSHPKDDVEAHAAQFVNDEVKNVEDALQGAMDIIAQSIGDDVKIRDYIRRQMKQFGKIVSNKKKDAVDEKETYAMYYAYEERVSSVASHRIMAMDRGEQEKILTIKIVIDEEYTLAYALRKVLKYPNTTAKKYIEKAVEDGLKRLALPSVEREIRSELTQKAQDQSIDVFSLNLEKLLLQPPMKQKCIMGFDPAFRTGCKLAIIDTFGKLLKIDVIYPHPPTAKPQEAKSKMLKLLHDYPVDIIAIGNGTASRESEAFVAKLIQDHHLKVKYTIVSEAGASVYSASKLAQEEFKELKVEQRSAISIARRILDPLAELIKIDPQSIGVGQYQHDLPQAKLKEHLNFVVSKAVNRVGVNVNTASVELLKQVSGLSGALAKEIVSYREENGMIRTRKELLKVKKMGPKSFQQAAGFLRIEDGDEPLDRSAIHPESYELTSQILNYYQLDVSQIGSELAKKKLQNVSALELSKKFGSDEYTMKDIMDAIKIEFRDYRENYDAPVLRSDILKIEDVHVGDEMEGVVRNVVDFGAFVDVGLHEDGLVHISKMSKQRIKHPSQITSVGDIVKVYVCGIDIAKERIQLSFLPINQLKS